MIDVVILCGGEANRMKKLKLFVPKILYMFSGMYLFENILNSLKKIAFNSVIFVCNKKNHNIIKKTINKKLPKSNSVKFINENYKMGTGGHIFHNRKDLSEDVLVIFGDLIIKFDINIAYKNFKKNNLDCLIFVQNNGHFFDSDLIQKKKNETLILHKKPHKYKNFSKNIFAIEPIIFIKKKLLDKFDIENKNIDFIHHIIFEILKKRDSKVDVFNFDEYKNYQNYIVDCGIPERYLLMKSIFG